MIDIDVLCVGATAYDFYFAVDRLPGSDEKTTARAFLSCGGGPAANAAVTAAGLGRSAALVGYLGRDIQGDRHLQELAQAGVDTRWIVRGDIATPTSCVWVTPDGRRSLVNYRNKDALLRPNDVDLSSVRAKVVLFDGHEPHLSASVIERASATGAKTVLDAGSFHTGTSALYDVVDYLVCSLPFAQAVTGQHDPGEALGRLSQKNNNVVITLGAEGLFWKRGPSKGRRPAFSVRSVDTTGAGDVFHGAFCAGLVSGKGWEDTLSYASAAAALSCTRLGGRTGIPGADEVDALLNRQQER